jgi:hypothetical protein
MVRPFLQVSCVLVFVLLAATMPAQATLIDGFDSGPQLLRVNPTTTLDTDEVYAGTAMGHYRNASLDLNSGKSEISMLINMYDQLDLSFNQGTGAKGTAVITWDGDISGGGPTLIILNQDLTDGSTSDRIRVSLNFDDLPIDMTFTAYSSSSLTDYVSQGTISLSGGITGATYRDLFFNATSGSPSFAAATGAVGPADFAHIKALTLTIGGAGVTPGADLSLTKIESVPEPSTFVLLGVGAVSLLAFAWRRRKASR